jgi:hypothetical protein
MDKLLKNIDSFKTRIAYYKFDGVRTFADSNIEEDSIDFSGLNEHEQLALLIYAYTLSDLCVFKRYCASYFGWEPLKVAKLVREINAEKENYWIDIDATFDQKTGLLSGKGYQFHQV